MRLPSHIFSLRVILPLHICDSLHFLLRGGFQVAFGVARRFLISSHYRIFNVLRVDRWRGPLGWECKGVVGDGVGALLAITLAGSAS